MQKVAVEAMRWWVGGGGGGKQKGGLSWVYWRAAVGKRVNTGWWATAAESLEDGRVDCGGGRQWRWWVSWWAAAAVVGSRAEDGGT